MSQRNAPSRQTTVLQTRLWESASTAKTRWTITTWREWVFWAWSRTVRPRQATSHRRAVWSKLISTEASTIYPSTTDLLRRRKVQQQLRNWTTMLLSHSRFRLLNSDWRQLKPRSQWSWISLLSQLQSQRQRNQTTTLKSISRRFCKSLSFLRASSTLNRILLSLTISEEPSSRTKISRLSLKGLMKSDCTNQ